MRYEPDYAILHGIFEGIAVGSASTLYRLYETLFCIKVSYDVLGLLSRIAILGTKP